MSHPDTSITPFNRDSLFISLYQSCGHRKAALGDAAALTDTIIAKLLRKSRQNGVIELSEIKAACKEVLKNFDTTAATYYSAYYG